MRALLLFIAFIVVQFVAAALALLLTNWPAVMSGGGLSNTTPDPVMLGTSLLVCEGLLSAAAWFFLYYKRREKNTAAPAASSAKALGTGVRSLGARMCFSAVAVVLWAFGLSLLLSPLNLPDDGTSATFEAMKQSVPCLLQLVFLGPLCEELVFRAGIVRPLSLTRLGGLGASFVSALAFALVHGNLAQGIPALVIGFVLGVLYLRTNSLHLCLIGHVANNAFAVILLFFPHLTDFTTRWPAAAVLALAALHLGLAVLNTWRAVR